MSEKSSLSSIFGANTFDYNIIKEKLPSEAYKKLQDTINNGTKLDMKLATAVAHALKEWAISRGATHFTHVFQPLVRPSAEKHDSFLTAESFSNGTKPVERFNASQLVQSEPDASSMPSGGIRSTFEARGYNAWDPTSPAYLTDSSGNVTLCIPSVYISFTGEALDKKTPLLRSIDRLDRAARKVLDLLDKPTSRVSPVVGPEQEFFIISRDHYRKRPDLVLTGTTLIGKVSPKGQKLEDHYFGSISDKILDYFKEVEKEAYKVGIPLKTRHNEVAPCQYEVAPLYEHVNVSCDHNTLFMDILDRVAHRKGLECLFHEKPFRGINGSGKHNNWSLMTAEGRNLFDPGHTEDEQLQFLLFLVAVVNAVHRRADILRSSVATPGNDYRLGANEAPPAIISVYLGSKITEILEKISKGEEYGDVNSIEDLDLGLQQLPMIKRDNTDRNRTSPFAFTGEKFEFRAVGSSQSLSFPNAFLNAAVTESLEDIYSILKTLIEKGHDLPKAILETIKQVYNQSSRIVFNGDNYSDEWITEAEKRGLSNIRNSFEALKVTLTDDSREFFEHTGVLTQKENKGRYNALVNRQIHRTEIKAAVMLDMVQKGVIPALARYINELGKTRRFLPDDQDPFITRVTGYWKPLHMSFDQLNKNLEQLHTYDDLDEAANHAVYQIEPAMKTLRKVVDEIEGFIPSDLWPFPSYTDILHGN
ncbi:MAG: glutamine synthetase III [Candidatus Odinarchaeota archaeon]